MTFHLFEEYAVVRKAHAFVLDVYKHSASFPKHELFGVTSQLRRSAASVPANICEGKARGSDKELFRYLMIARASLTEASYFLLLAKDLSYLPGQSYQQLSKQADEIGRMTAGMLASIRRQRPRFSTKLKAHSSKPLKEGSLHD